MATEAKRPRRVGGNRTEDAPAGLNKYDTQRKAIALRSAGHTYREIGAALGCDHTWARRLIVDGLRENIAADVDSLRELEGQRLDKLTTVMWSIASNPDDPRCTAAANTLIRVMERRSRLFGLDAPVHVDVEQKAAPEGAVLVIAGGREQYLASLQRAKPQAIST